MFDTLEEIQPTASDLRKEFDNALLLECIFFPTDRYTNSLLKLKELRDKKTIWYGMCEERLRDQIDDYLLWNKMKLEGNSL